VKGQINKMGSSAQDVRALRHPRGSGKVGEVADWEGCDAELLQKVIGKAGYKHCALRFGYSRDGGAYAIGVYAGLDYFTDYVRPGESIDDYLRDLLAALEEYEPDDKIPTKKQREKKA
jgi:hypothetical protein